MPKYVIDDKVYDTEKAEVICKNAVLSIFGGYSIILGRNISQPKSGTIYRTKKDAYFFECGSEGNAYTITEEQAKHYLKHHRYEKYAEPFGELEEA
ncbi:MAG: hypothetical protein Q4A41_04545 [Bacillota bacterium]|nr:hypothetical protein [Bacillota bacterium]